MGWVHASDCLVTGRPPFHAATIQETLRQVQHDNPVHPSQLNSNIPVSLATVCLKCLEKDSSARYRGAAELADDLQRFLNGEPVLRDPPENWNE